MRLPVSDYSIVVEPINLRKLRGTLSCFLGYRFPPSLPTQRSPAVADTRVHSAGTARRVLSPVLYRAARDRELAADRASDAHERSGWCCAVATLAAAHGRAAR